MESHRVDGAPLLLVDVLVDVAIQTGSQEVCACRVARHRVEWRPAPMTCTVLT
jgi:hypothetical protein